MEGPQPRCGRVTTATLTLSLILRLRLRLTLTLTLTRPVLRFRNAVWGNESFRLRVVEERSLMLNLHKNCGEANPKPKPKP